MGDNRNRNSQAGNGKASGAANTYAIDLVNFSKRLTALYSHWKGNKVDLWGDQQGRKTRGVVNGQKVANYVRALGTTMATSLNSNECFLLQSGSSIFTWHGNQSAFEQQQLAAKVADFLKVQGNSFQKKLILLLGGGHAAETPEKSNGSNQGGPTQRASALAALSSAFNPSSGSKTTGSKPSSSSQGTQRAAAVAALSAVLTAEKKSEGSPGRSSRSPPPETSPSGFKDPEGYSIAVDTYSWLHKGGQGKKVFSVQWNMNQVEIMSVLLNATRRLYLTRSSIRANIGSFMINIQFFHVVILCFIFFILISI